MKASELAGRLGAQFIPGSGGDVDLSGLAPLDAAGPSQVTFLTNPKYEAQLQTSKAGVVIIAKNTPGLAMGQIVHENPHYAFARTAQLFVRPHQDFTGISEQAFVAKTARLGKNVTIYPFAYIGSDAVIGDNVTVYANAYIGSGSQISDDCIIHPNVVVAHGSRIGRRVIVNAGAVVGADGFGFAPGKDDIAKVPQVGIVVLEDDVEIGSLCNIDRGALTETRIKRGTKLDSLVHVAHNVVIGENCMLCGQTGIAGSARIGNWVITAGQTAINGHIKVGDRIHLGARGVIDNDLLEAGAYHGFPAKPSRTHWREQASIAKIPDLIREVRELREKVRELSEKSP
jgi:UDP-3-O-[3-hydroxymyristoyl] glucosamine N-acyltransferase